MPNRLIDFASKQDEGKPLRLDDIAGVEVTITGAGFGNGDFGEYAMIDVVNPEGETMNIQTSAMLVLDALSHAMESQAFPLLATFKKRGRQWIME